MHPRAMTAERLASLTIVRLELLAILDLAYRGRELEARRRARALAAAIAYAGRP